jgi:hypothetical protein
MIARQRNCHVATAEIKAQIDAMSEEDRFFAQAYLQHLAHQDDAGYRSMLGQRLRRIEAGEKFTLAQVQELHRQLEQQGL